MIGLGGVSRQGELKRGGISFKCVVYTSGIRERERGIRRDGERERERIIWEGHKV